MSLGACNETATSDVVFIGTVESIEPKFLSEWNLASPLALKKLNDAYIEAERHPSDVSLNQLKARYLQTFPELTDEEKQAVTSTKTSTGVSSLFYLTLNRGMRVHFRVKTLFKQGDDDDDDDEPEELDVWNPFGDCGFSFQAGETYLVYANREESSDYLFTGSCTRTRRVSDAGEDLGYLFFYQDDREQSGRLEGFVTTDGRAQLDFDPLHEPESISAAVPGTVIQLDLGGASRHALADGNGRFVFDGLAGGTYRLSTFAAGYPMIRQALGVPREIEVKAEGCTHQILLLPAEKGKN
jgi:hypothetical protein